MPLAARINVVTLGVHDLPASIAFYERLGWRRSEEASTEEIAFFALGRLTLALFPRHLLAEDAQLTDTTPGFGGFTLAQNVESEAAVDQALATALAAGARLLKPAGKVAWGGYSGYFADPDGHPWEICYNPYLPLDEGGNIILPP